MKSLSKEDVLLKYPCAEGSTMENMFYEWSDILKAIDEYAKQYSRWILESGYTIYADMYYHLSDEAGDNPLTPDQLYEIYQQHKSTNQ